MEAGALRCAGGGAVWGAQRGALLILLGTQMGSFRRLLRTVVFEADRQRETAG